LHFLLWYNRRMPRIDLIPDAPESLLESVRKPLREYNRAASPDFYKFYDDPKSTVPLNLFAFDEDNHCIAGLLGNTLLAWLKIDILSVSPAHRRHGLGTALMLRAEEEARKRDCKYSFVDTMSYQAPDFYPRLGYTQVGRIQHWDSHGHDKLFFTKTLS
jgi:GNAT superfamily N-acetyltransferase